MHLYGSRCKDSIFLALLLLALEQLSSDSIFTPEAASFVVKKSLRELAFLRVGKERIPDYFFLRFY